MSRGCVHETDESKRYLSIAAGAAFALAGAAVIARGLDGQELDRLSGRRAKNVILFIGDGMGVSTVTATRVSLGWGCRTVGRRSVPLHGALENLLVRFDHGRQRADDDGHDERLQHQRRRPRLGRDDRVPGLQPRRRREENLDAARAGQAAGHESGRRQHGAHHTRHAGRDVRHINDRNNENAIALQALPDDATYNRRLGDGIDMLFGGGRRFFVPTTTADDEGGARQPDRRARSPRRVSRARATPTSTTRRGSTA